jgi:endonuclease/exonuclease/phosphatase family metal-dependent hydrolase
MTQELTGQWLLLGDFNMPASDWLDRYPSLRFYPRTAEPTHPTKNPVEAIDYCVAPRELTVHAEVLTEEDSDHLPIFVRYQLET